MAANVFSQHLRSNKVLIFYLTPVIFNLTIILIRIGILSNYPANLCNQIVTKGY